jgi:Spy/CpxP family protein refolding chaperone
MMKLRILGMTVALAGSMAIAGVARAQPHGEMMGHGGGMEFLHAINLTDEQKAQAKEIMKAGWQQMRPLMKQERALHEQQMNTLLSAGAVTAEQMQPILAQEEALRTQIDTVHLNTMIQMRGLLTAEQLSKAATMHAQLEQLHAQEHAVMGEPAAEEGPPQ